MPRFDNEGFNPDRRIDNDSRDRSVPEDENYYGSNPFNLDFNLRGNDDVIDNQGNTDINALIDSYSTVEPPRRYGTASDNDFDRLQSSQREERRRQSPPKKPKRSGALSKGKRIIVAIIALLLVLVILAAALINGALGKINYDDKRDNQYISSSELKSDSQVKNILLLGVDARPDEESKTSRADSMMLISVDSKHNCIKMVSFLRDTWVYIPAHDGKQRLNAACTYDGYHGVVDTIEYNFGVDIDGYVVADFNMFKVLVDSIGGVEVDVTKKEAKEINNHKIRYDHVKIKSGKHTLTGEQALAYCRIRKIDTDFMRAKRQRTVIQSILTKAKKTNPATLYKMVSNSAPYIETDLSKGELMGIAVKALGCLGDMVETRVPFDTTWRYETISGNSVITIDPDKNKEMLVDYIYNKTAEEIKAEEDD